MAEKDRHLINTLRLLAKDALGQIGSSPLLLLIHIEFRSLHPLVFVHQVSGMILCIRVSDNSLALMRFSDLLKLNLDMNLSTGSLTFYFIR